MRPVEQRVVDPDKGDCFFACIASILELPLEDIPELRTDDKSSQWEKWVDWFRAANLTLICLTHHGPVPGYAIRSIPSYNFEARLHAVVTYDGQVVWDPSPTRRNYDDDCYKQWARHWIIIPLDLMKPIQRDKLKAIYAP